MTPYLSRLLLLAGALLSAGIPAVAQVTLVTDGTNSTTGCTSFVASASTVTLSPTGCLALAQQGVALQVTRSGDGTGTVSSSPAGIDCGATCTANFPLGSMVTLTATPGANSTFAGWSGACTGAGTCPIPLSAATQVTAGFALIPPPPVGRLINISTRLAVQTGDNVLIGGLIIGGSTPKTVVIRARGPSLASAGIANPLANPTLQLFSGQNPIASNDDWGTSTNASAITASGFAPTNAQESAILATLNPGAYTAIVSGVGATSGVGIVEVFEVDRPEQPLQNISSRGQVGTANDVMIGGFVIQGALPQTVLIRALGPSLTAFGVQGALGNPRLQLFSGANEIAVNDDWGTATNAAAITATGQAPTNALESAILVTLNPGAYTAIVSGVGGATGVGLVEIYAK